jgi:AraC-like DNA-binding protein
VQQLRPALKSTTLHHPLWSHLQPSPTPAECERRLAKVIPLRRLEALTPPSAWWHHDGHLPISSLQLAATVGSPFLIESFGQSDHCLLLGHDGQANVKHPTGTCTLGANGAVILPGQSWTLICEQSMSLTAIGFDPLRLFAAARAMAPPGWAPPSTVELSLNRVQVLPTLTDPICGTLVSTITLVLPAIGRVSQLGGNFLETFLLEQQLYRLMAALVFPSLRDSQPQPSTSSSRESISMDQRLDRVLDYISLHLHQPLPLSVLEENSNYCRRSLHYAFQERFHCSPMQWIRQQRMALALQRLQQANPGDTVRAVATACGYRSLGRFSIDFQRAYGCKPSAVKRGLTSPQLKTEPQSNGSYSKLA